MLLGGVPHGGEAALRSCSSAAVKCLACTCNVRLSPRSALSKHLMMAQRPGCANPAHALLIGHYVVIGCVLGPSAFPGLDVAVFLR
jgi:hypothetical protein